MIYTNNKATKPYWVPLPKFSISDDSRLYRISMPVINVDRMWPNNEVISDYVMSPVLDQIEMLFNESEPLTVDELGTILHLQKYLTYNLKHRLGIMVSKLTSRQEYRKVLATREIMIMRNELNR